MALKLSCPEQLKTRKYRHKLFVIPCKGKLERLSCIICNDILVDPHQTECGCRCCQSCLGDLRWCEERCPGCQEDIITKISDKVRPDKAVEREIFDLEIWCLNERCHYQCQLKKLIEHLEMCEFREKKCDKCEDLYPYKDRSAHEESQCKMIMSKCDQCGSEMTKKDLDGKHRNVEGNIDNVCDNWKGVCPLGCCDEVQDNVKVHLRVCLWVTVECPMKELGCTKKLPRIDMNAHIETDLAVHARLMTEEIVRLREESEDLESHMAKNERKERAVIDELKRSAEDMALKVTTLTNRAMTSERLLEDLWAELNHARQLVNTATASFSPSLVPINSFGEFSLGYGDIAGVVADAWRHGNMDNRRFMVEDTTLLQGVVLYFVLSLDYEFEVVTLALNTNQSSLRAIASLTPTTVDIRWGNANSGISVMSTDIFICVTIDSMSMTMRVLMENYSGRDLCLDIEVLQRVEIESGSS